MQALLQVILPVFLVMGFGYIAVWRGYIGDDAIDGLMKFTQNFAIPCLLFRAISSLDLGQDFDPALLGSFYAGATAGFLAGLVGARYLFNRPWEDSVAIGFCTLYSNSVLLGLPITERAFGPDALQPNFAIIALHAPFCYILGFTVMEIVRAKGGGLRRAAHSILSAMLKNALMIGIAFGFLVNILAVPVPGVLVDAVDLMARAALPAALFGLGGVLFRYRPEGDMATIAYVCAISLVLHPVIVWTLGGAVGLTTGQFRSAVLTASVAPGVNAYIFANMYGVAKRVVASSVLIGTGLSVISVWFWLTLLPENHNRNCVGLPSEFHRTFCGTDQPGDRPRNRSDRRRSSSSVVRSRIEMPTRMVATARMVGEICSRKPVNICQGNVFCPADPTNSTTTTSSNEVMKANNPPEITPGRISGICTRKNVVTGLAPILAAARVSERSKPDQASR